MRLEQGRALYNYGAILLQRSCPQGAAFQTGLAHLQQAQELFTACHAAIDLKRSTASAEPTTKPLLYSLYLHDALGSRIIWGSFLDTISKVDSSALVVLSSSRNMVSTL